MTTEGEELQTCNRSGLTPVSCPLADVVRALRMLSEFVRPHVQRFHSRHWSDFWAVSLPRGNLMLVVIVSTASTGICGGSTYIASKLSLMCFQRCQGAGSSGQSPDSQHGLFEPCVLLEFFDAMTGRYAGHRQRAGRLLLHLRSCF